MINLDIIRGVIKFKKKLRNFDFDHKRLTIYPKISDDNCYSYDCFNDDKDKGKFNYLVGKTDRNKNIFFIDVEYCELDYNDMYIAFPGAYCISKYIIDDDSFSTKPIANVQLTSTIITSLQYNDIQLLKRDSGTKLFDNEIRNFFPLDNEIAFVETKIDHNSLNVNTSLIIDYAKPKSLITWYHECLKIIRTFRFLYNRKNVFFDSIDIEFYKNFDKHELVYNELVEYKMYYINKVNEFKYQNLSIVKDTIFNHFNDVYNLLKDKDFYFYYPENDKDNSYIDIKKFIVMCGTFEREFEETFSKSLEDINNTFNIVKKDIISQLEVIQSNYDNHEKQEEVGNIIQIVERLSKSLASRLNYCYEQFEFVMSERFAYHCKTQNINKCDFMQISRVFGNTRNKMVHTFSNIKFNNQVVVGYLMARDLIYCMILKRANFTDDEIKVMVKTVLEYT